MLLNHIYTGDSIQVIKDEILPESINLIFADPPYGISGKSLEWKAKKYSKVNESWDKISPEDYTKFTKNWIEACHTVMKSNGSLFVCCSKHNIAVVDTAIRASGFLVNNIIVWEKENAMPNMTGRTFTHSTEFIIWAVKGPKWVYNRDEAKLINPNKTKSGELKAMRDVWTIPMCGGKERIKGPDGKAAHKTQKPEALVERCIRICSNPGDLVLDPFLGSGTTAKVAKDWKRSYIGIEMNPDYVRMAEERLANQDSSKVHVLHMQK